MKKDLEIDNKKKSESYEMLSRLLLQHLSLEPYILNMNEKSVIKNIDNCYDSLVLKNTGVKLFYLLKNEKIPLEISQERLNFLRKYYSKLDGINLKNEERVFSRKRAKLQKVLSYDFIISDREIIEKLCENVSLENLLLNELSPKNLRTPWFTETKFYNFNKKYIALPDALDIRHMSRKEYWYLHWILINEQTVYEFNSWDDLRERIKDDFDQEINNQELLCNKCEYEHECMNEEECRYLDEMSEEERRLEISKPDYMELSIEKLIEDIAILLKQGLIYLSL